MKLTPVEHMNHMLRREIASKHRKLAQETANVLDGHPAMRKAAQAAIRRLNKSITLRVSKLMCQHDIRSQFVRTGVSAADGVLHHCALCKTSVYVT